MFPALTSLPVAEELESVTHVVGGAGGDEAEQPSHLLAHGKLLLLRKDDAGVGPLLGEPLGVKGTEMAYVEGIDGPSLGRGQGQLLVVGLFGCSCFQGGQHIDAALPQCGNEGVAHRILVAVQPNLHSARLASWCSRSSRSASCRSDSISASIASRLAW